MDCNSCGWHNPDGTMYCEGCGAMLDVTTSASRTEMKKPDLKNVTRPGSGHTMSVSASATPINISSDKQVEEADSKVVNGSIVMRLRVLRGGSKGRIFFIEEGTNLIGRWDPESGAFPEVDLEAEDVEAKISRKHALIERNGALVTIQDIGSLNGTFVNKSGRLEPGKTITLAHGDEIIIGKTFLRFEHAPAVDSQ